MKPEREIPPVVERQRVSRGSRPSAEPIFGRQRGAKQDARKQPSSGLFERPTAGTFHLICVWWSRYVKHEGRGGAPRPTRPLFWSVPTMRTPRRVRGGQGSFIKNGITFCHRRCNLPGVISFCPRYSFKIGLIRLKRCVLSFFPMVGLLFFALS